LWRITANGSNTVITSDPTGYSQEQLNFSMFWGVAIMMYEQTLISNESEFDNLVASGALQVGGSLSLIPGLPIGCQAGTPAAGWSAADPLLVRGCQLFHGLPQGFLGPAPIPPAATGVACIFCHGDPTFSENQQTLESQLNPFTQFTPFLSPVTDIGTDTRGSYNDLRDLGFANIGIRPVFTDMMLGRVDSYGNPLSYGRQYLNYLNAIAGGATPAAAEAQFLLDPFLINAVHADAVHAGALAQGSPLSFTPGTGPNPPGPPGAPVNWAKLETDGASKVPDLRNVGLTPPYFSWGGYATLRQVIEVYNRGLSSRNVTNSNAGVSGFDAHGTACTSGDDSGSGPDGNHAYQDLVTPPLLGTHDCNTNITGLMVPLGLSACDAPMGTLPRTLCMQNHQTTANDDLAAMVRFLTSLTDPRVQCSAAPFDHPALTVITGQTATDTNGDGLADDTTYKLPAVGAAGFKHNSGNCIPNAGDLFAPGMQTTSGGAGVSIP
jgi:hypothetical protein